MLITTSRNADIFQKRFCKYLSVFFPEIKHIPRGKSQLKKLFEKASYIGDDFFLLVGKKKENIELMIYKRKQKEFFPDKVFLISEIFYKSPKEKIQKTNAKGKFFYFLEKTDKDSEIKASQKESEVVFKIKKEIFFSFKILKEEKA
jgi:rRNA maturation protein Rpf1